MKNDSIMVITALLTVFAGGTSAAPLASPDQGYVARGSGVIGRNHPLPATPVKARKGAAAKPVKAGALAGMQPLNPAISQALGDSFNLSTAGDAAAKRNAWPEAERDYQQALDIVPDNRTALYGMAKCAEIKGDTATAIHYYRTAIYTSNTLPYRTDPGDGFQENDVTHLMPFALALNRAGQAAEAVFIYNRAASLLDYQDSQYHGGQPTIRVLLPELVAENPVDTQVEYTPERLQALADTAVADGEMSFGSNKEALAHMREAVKLYPESPVTRYYLGEALMSSNDYTSAKAAYATAVQLGDERTVKMAKERIMQLR